MAEDPPPPWAITPPFAIFTDDLLVFGVFFCCGFIEAPQFALSILFLLLRSHATAGLASLGG